MKTEMAQINLLVAWTGILLGFVSGMVLGLFFHREDWLGGYASFKRRLYRLAHISFFGLGALNLLFWLTVRFLPASSPLLAVASWMFVVGAITMPICCVVMAHLPKLHLVFSVPVISFIAGAGLTLLAVMRSGNIHAAIQEEQFSLSRWERGQLSSASVFACVPVNNSGARKVESRRKILPLPAGEGRGEGEVLESHSLSQYPHASPSDHFNLLQP